MDWVKDVLYGPAGNTTQTRYLETKGASAPQDVYYLQTHAYNTLYQLTRMTTVREGGGGGTIMDMEYRFSATQNNGKITQHKDWVSGEEVTYQYDSLQRLIAATTTGPEWGQSFGYDGFGNLLSKSVTKGSAPTLSINVDGATNRITTSGFGYDANGNTTSIPGQTGIAFDALNRLTTASGDQYSYRPDNKRVWKRKADTTEEIFFHSISGARLGVYRPVIDSGSLRMVVQRTEIYFGRKRIRVGNDAVAEDRLGSTRKQGSTGSRFYPYGEELTPTTSEDRQKFATYYRDSATQLDYADQRYYLSTAGRFLTTDPFDKSGAAVNPGSWNRYSYVASDPINFHDPNGLAQCWINSEVQAGPGSWIHDVWCRSALLTLTDSAEFELSEPMINGEEWPFLDEVERTFGAVLDQKEVFNVIAPLANQARDAFSLPACWEFFVNSGAMSGDDAIFVFDPTEALRLLHQRIHISFVDIPQVEGYNIRADTIGVGIPRPQIVEYFPFIGRYWTEVNIRFDIMNWSRTDPASQLMGFMHEIGHAIGFLSAGRFSPGGFIQHDPNQADNDHNSNNIREKCVTPLLQTRP